MCHPQHFTEVGWKLIKIFHNRESFTDFWQRLGFIVIFNHTLVWFEARKSSSHKSIAVDSPSNRVIDLTCVRSQGKMLLAHGWYRLSRSWDLWCLYIVRVWVRCYPSWLRYRTGWFPYISTQCLYAVVVCELMKVLKVVKPSSMMAFALAVPSGVIPKQITALKYVLVACTAAAMIDNIFCYNLWV